MKGAGGPESIVSFRRSGRRLQASDTHMSRSFVGSPVWCAGSWDFQEIMTQPASQSCGCMQHQHSPCSQLSPGVGVFFVFFSEGLFRPAMTEYGSGLAAVRGRQHPQQTYVIAMDACSSACSTAQAVQDIPAGWGCMAELQAYDVSLFRSHSSDSRN